MTTTRALVPALLAVAAVYLACIAIAGSSMAARPEVAAAIGFDLTVTATAAFWWLAVRPGHVRPRVTWRIAALGFVVAKLVVGLHALGMAGGAAELAVLVVLAARIRRIVRRTRAERRGGAGLHAALDAGFAEAIPVRAIAAGLALEVSAVILAFTGWFARPPGGWSMHRSSGYVAIVGVLCGLVAIEGVGMHVVLAPVAPTVAIVASVMSAYGLLWIIGNVHAVRLSPLRFAGDDLVIERGLRARVIVPRDRIARVERVSDRVAGAADLSYFAPNMLLVLDEPVAVRGLFGRTKLCDRIAITVDDPAAFERATSSSCPRAC